LDYFFYELIKKRKDTRASFEPTIYWRVFWRW